MELKRYVLLEDNQVIDTNNEFKVEYQEKGCKPDFKGYELYYPRKNSKYPTLRYYGGRFCCSKDSGDAIDTSDEIFELVRNDDYALIKGKLHKIELYKEDDLVEINGEMVWIDCYRVCDMGYGDSESLEDTEDEIEALYKWQGKNLICVWEREK